MKRSNEKFKGKNNQFKDDKEFGNKGRGPNRNNYNDKFEHNKRVKQSLNNTGDSCKGRSSNNPSWYASDPNLLKSSASFSYTWPTGNAIDLGPYAEKVHLGSVPGIMAIAIDPQVGWADNQNSPITLASREEYAFIRYANAGHTNYDPTDLLLYHIAMDSCYSFYSYLRRIYGVCRTYSNVNRYYPKAVIEAMGVDFDDIMSHLADLNYAINVFATMFSRLNVPTGMSYVTKHMWMYDNVYTDANTPRGQTYMFVPRSFFQYAYDANNAGMLHRVDFDSGYNSTSKPSTTYQQLIDFMYSLMNPVIADEDIGIISGDILKAYGPEGVMKIAGVTLDYGVAPIYNLEVLEIINNITLLGPCDDDVTQHVEVGNSYIVSKPHFEHYIPSITDITDPGLNALHCDRFINFRRDNIQPEDSMVVTRLMNIAEPNTYNTTTHKFECHTVGSETAAFARIYWYGRAEDNPLGEWKLRWTKPFTMSITFTQTPPTGAFADAASELALGHSANANLILKGIAQSYSDGIAEANKFVELVSQFDYHPPLGLSAYTQFQLYNFNPDTSSSNTQASYFNELNGFVYDLANYAIIGKSELKNLAEVALLNMFHLNMGRK